MGHITNVIVYICTYSFISFTSSALDSKVVLLLFSRQGPAVRLVARPRRHVWLENPLAHAALADHWHE